MKTINQVNAAVKRNPTINFYKWLSSDAGRYSQNYRNNYFDFKRFGRTDSLTITGNFIYGAAVREFDRIRNEYNSKSSLQTRNSKNFEIEFSGYVLEFQLTACQDIEGTRLTIYSNFEPFKSKRWHSYEIRSKSTFAALDIQEYFEKTILKKVLFAPGLFRNIQILRNCTKADAIKFYHTNIKKQRPEENDIDINKALRQQIKRRLNILVSDDFNNKALLHILNTNQRSTTTKKLFKHPSIFELSDRYSSQYDTDGNEEVFIDEVYSDYPNNSIFA